MPSSALQIRPMTRADLDVSVAWAAAEGWNPGWHDADTFHAADPGGFLVGLIEGEPVAAISAVRYGKRFGFIGFYIVRPEFRGRGHGISIWRAAMQQLAGRTIGLDGVVAQQESYRRSGFELAWNNVRYEGLARPLNGPDHAIVQIAPGCAETPELVAYDAAFFPDDRRRFVRHWIAQPRSTSLMIRHEGQFAGYGVIRPCRVGFKVGPAVRRRCRVGGPPAARADLARRPGRAGPAGHPGRQFLGARTGTGPCHAAGVPDGADVRGSGPRLPLERTFGITTFELG
jgi:predicted N-acetyltransferase YhbS